MKTVETSERKARDAADKLVRLQRELKAAEARREDAQRDVDEARKGRRFGEPVTGAQMSASWRALKDVQSAIARLMTDIATQKTEVKAANVAVTAAMNENASRSRLETAEAQSAMRAARKAEKRASTRWAHEERIRHLIVSGRGWASGEDVDVWASRLRMAVVSLEYCDDTVDGEPVTMPWNNHSGQ